MDNLIPTDEGKKQIYELYKFIFHSKFAEHKKENLLNHAFTYEPWSWRVIGITTNALVEFKKNNFKYKTGTFYREHFKQARHITMRKMLSNLMEYEKWWEWYWDNDKTIIVLGDERDKKNTIRSKIIDIDWKLGYFEMAKLVGFKFSVKKEGEFLKKLASENNIDT